MVERLTGKVLAIRLPLHVPRFRIFNDPGKEFEVQLVQISINWLNWNSRSLSKLRSYLECALGFNAGAPDQVIPNRERLAEVGLSEAEVEAIGKALGGRFASEFVDGKGDYVTVQLQNVFVKHQAVAELSL